MPAHKNTNLGDAVPDFPVIGIGASAGGIAALESLLRSIPAAPRLALIVVQHHKRDGPNQLARVLSRWTTLAVREANDGIALEQDCLFVAPSDRALHLENGVFVTRPLDGGSTRAGIDTIDSLFESLARDLGRRAIAVVLSGTGADGAAGAIRIKQAGGMVLVQEPTTAMYAGMPLAAIASGAADRVVPLGSLARELLACAYPEYERSALATTWADDVSKALAGIVQLLREKASCDLNGYNTTPLLYRIQRRMELRHERLFPGYLALLRDDRAELTALARSVPLHLTEFFRNADAWKALEHDVIPKLFRESGDRPLRIWTPACATGEEAYSITMLLAEHASTLARAVEFKVFATDSSAAIVARASRGAFGPAALNALSLEQRQRFFYEADGAFRVKRELREKMVFAPQDLLADAPFPDVDLVTCRNLLIHLEDDAVTHVVSLLRSALRVGGYLFLGKAEALSARRRSGFDELSPNTHIYRKTHAASNTDLAFAPRPERHAASWSEELRVTHEELDASRVELRALNVELRDSHCRLNLANEELDHANVQLRDKTDALQTQSNVLSSGAVLTLFLDTELRVRWFTPGVSALFPVKAQDLGRKITDLVPKFERAEFLDDVRAVMRTGESREAEVRTLEGRSYLKRIRPFRAGAGDGAGVAINFTDITARAAAENGLRESEEHVKKLFALMPAGVYTCDADGRLTFYNRHAAELWGREPTLGGEQDRFCGSFRLWTPAGAPLKHEDCPMADAVHFGRAARNLNVVIEQPTGTHLVANMNIDPLRDREGRLAGAINVFVEVGDRKRVEQA